ncbi:TetR family transcriptional regulator [Planctomycetales bacterium ZRK34]|nr:TetR family transcriptional regulator [Planctomycetales bacterium ZRK34]
MTDINPTLLNTPNRETLASDRVTTEKIAPRPAQGPTPFLSCEHILEATEACFADKGYDGTTIRAIATRLGCSVGSIYRYFTDKRDLLRACAARAFAPVARYLDAEAVSFEESLRMYLQLAAKFPQMYRLMFWLECVDDPTTAGPPRAIADLLEGWTKLLGSRPAAEDAWATTHGLIMMGLSPDQVEQRVLSKAADQPTAAPAPASESPTQLPSEPTIHIAAEVERLTPREDVTLL